MSKISHTAIVDLGIPVRSVNWVRLHAGRNRQGEPCLYATMGQQAENCFVLQIDPLTGGVRQFVSPVPGSNYPTATLMSKTGILYIGAAYAGHLLSFDPAVDRLEDLGPIHPEAATFPCRLDEGPDGRIWIGSYGTADLTGYHPQTRKFTCYGRMDPVDMYNYPLVNSDGTVACLIRQTQPHVVVFDPETGTHQTVGPVTTKGQDTIDLRRAGDGCLYIESSQGHFRLEGNQAIPVETIPAVPPEPPLSDGTTFAFTDAAEQRYRNLKTTRPDGSSRTFELAYQASGSDIFYLHHGPDGCVYGSSILPLHLFCYHPQTDQLIDFGRCSEAAGEAYSMANFDGKLYISVYPGARISVYDPARPYHFGNQPGDNPRDLGRIDALSYRPRATLAGPGGRIWTASIPDYGLWGGPLSWYDPATGEKKAYYRICGDASCYTLAWLQDQRLIAVGTTIAGGSGTRPKETQAVLFLWDYQAAEKVWEGTLKCPVEAFNALLVGPDGRLYGTARSQQEPPLLFVFDPQTRRFTATVPLPPGQPLDLGLQNGPGDQIYGFTSHAIYRLNPQEFHVTEILREDGGFTVAGPILGDTLYFATGHRLRRITF